MTTMFSLWLMPPISVRARFRRIIDNLAQQFGTPRFVPHITLCSGEITEVDIERQMHKLATQLAPVPVQLTTIDYTDAYFRCLFIRAALTPALSATHAKTAEIYERGPDAAFMPHLSLIYGNLARAKKEKLIHEIDRDFDTDFIASEISICVPVGTPDTWRLIGPFPLTGNPPLPRR